MASVLPDAPDTIGAVSVLTERETELIEVVAIEVGFSSVASANTLDESNAASVLLDVPVTIDAVPTWAGWATEFIESAASGGNFAW